MKSDKILVVIAATTLLTIAATTAATQILSVRQQEAAAQNTTMTNQTIPPTENQTMTNQTQGGGAIVAATANLTQADFESVIDNLNSASEALQTNDTTEAYDAVNSVENELFEIATDQGEQNMKTLMQIFKPLQDSVDSARDALRNNDTTNALQQLNSTDVELLKITQQLPAEGEQEDEEDTEE
jgi:hypothetical protein